MKGDFSRSTFRRIKHYRKVKLQQGRVMVDADWNEQVDIQAYYDQMSKLDIVGSSGGSVETAGFSITPAGKGAYQVGAGRYYVNGLIVENENDVNLQDSQLKAGRYLAYLKVWEQDVTALDDPEIRESALGGPDTSVRSKITWQVLLHRLDAPNIDEEWDKLLTSSSNYSDGTLRARAKPQGKITDACMLPPGAGYRRLENQLYRIEVHDSGRDGNGATFKWSRDNASLAAKVNKISGSQLTVTNIGRDRYDFRFKEDQWFEITDDSRELSNRPGTLAKITKVDEGTRTIVFDVTTAIGDAITEENYPEKFNPKIIRWDSHGSMPIPAHDGADDGNYVAIEDGLEVKFSGGNYRTGDYWYVPARTVKGDVEWPQDGSKPEALPPEGVVHHFCRLAILEFGPDLSLEKVTDLRRFFPSITTLTTIQYVGGDGQKGASRTFLPHPLMAGVSRGGTPLEGVAVRFEVKVGEGAVFSEEVTGRAVDPSTNRQVTVFTDNAGIARCFWQLDDMNDSQQVEAVMLDVTGDVVHLPVVFNAVMERDGPPTGLRVASGLIKDKVATETYKIIGPFYHGVDAIPESTAPPSILLGETNVDVENVKMTETVRQMENLTLMSVLNKHYGVPAGDSENSSSLANTLGLDDYLDKDDDTPKVPVFFKPVSVDKEKFYVFLANYNKGPSQIAWTGWSALAGGAVKQMTIGMNADGRLEIFAINANDQPVRISQSAENGSWGELVKMPAQKLKQIAVGTNANGTLHLFGIDAKNQIVHIWQEDDGSWVNNWTPFEPLVKAKKIIVSSNTDGRLEVFGIDMEDVPGHMWQTAATGDMVTWSRWFPMRGIKAKDMAVGTNKDGRLELFAIGYRHVLFDTSMVAVQYSEDLFRLSSLVRNKGKSFVMKPGVMKNIARTGAVKRVRDVAMTRELKAALYENAFKNVQAAQPKIAPPPKVAAPVDLVFHAWQLSPNGDWSSWGQLGNQRASKVAVASNADGRIEVFVISSDESLYHIWQTSPNNGWSGWKSMGGKVKDIAVASNADGRIEVFAVTPRTNLILSTGLLLNTNLIADKLNKESLDTLAETRKVKASNVATVLSNAKIVRKTDVSMLIKAEDVAKFTELAILKKTGRNVSVGHALYHIWQTSPNNGWSAWSSLGGKVKDIAIAANANGSLTALATGEDDSVINATSQTLVESEVNLRWWAIPAVDVFTRESGGGIGKEEEPSEGPEDKDVREKADEERKAAEEKALAERAAKEKAEAERKAAEAKAAAEKEAAEKAKAAKAAAKKAAEERAAAKRAAAEERAAAKRAAERASAAEKAKAAKAAAAAREAAKRAAAEKAAAARVAAEKAKAAKAAAAAREAAKRAAAEKAAAARVAAEKARAEKAAKAARLAAERAAAKKAAAEKAKAAAAAREAAKRAAAEKAAAERRAVLARAAAEKAAAEKAPTRRTAATSPRIATERVTTTVRPELLRAATINPNAQRCSEINKQITSLQTRLRNPSLPVAQRQTIGARIQALKAEKSRLNCPP